MSRNRNIDNDKLDRVVADARRERERREQDYRAKALRMYPWVCGRCAREFTRANVHELTVHHRDHDHDNNPEDGQQLGAAMPLLSRQRACSTRGPRSRRRL